MGLKTSDGVKTMQLKTVEVDGKQYAEIQDGKPVYLDDGGKTHVYDAPAMRGSLDRLNGVLLEVRGENETLKAAAQAFDGIEPSKAKEAIKVYQNLKDKQLIDAGEAERVRAEAIKGYEAKLNDALKEVETLKNEQAQDKLGAAFTGSKYVKDNLAIPADMVQAAFARHFEYQDGRITPRDSNGNPIYSASNPGEVANFDEALEILVNQYPHRDSILKGAGHSGSGAGALGEGGKRVITREQFQAQPPAEQKKLAAAAREGSLRITD